MEALANWAASQSGSEMLMTLTSSTLAILLAKFIWKEIWPLAILLAKFTWTKIWPLTILLVKYIIKLSCALAGLAESVLHRIFEYTGSIIILVSSFFGLNLNLQLVSCQPLNEQYMLGHKKT